MPTAPRTYWRRPCRSCGGGWIRCWPRLDRVGASLPLARTPAVWPGAPPDAASTRGCSIRPIAALGLAPPAEHAGDAAARCRVRLAEIADSLRHAAALLDELPEGPISVALPADSGEGIGCAESLRGAVWHWLRLDHGQIAAAFPCDPGWALWPLAEGGDGRRTGGGCGDDPSVMRPAGLGVGPVRPPWKRAAAGRTRRAGGCGHHRVPGRAAGGRRADPAGPQPGDPPRQHRKLQRLRAGTAGAAQRVLRPGAVRPALCRKPAPCRRAAGDRSADPQPARGAGGGLGRDARSRNGWSRWATARWTAACSKAATRCSAAPARRCRWT